MASNKRFVHIITGLTTGGAERALYNLLAGGLAQRYESAVISLSEAGTFGERIQALGVPVYTLGMRRGPDPLALLHLRALVRVIQPDVIQGWMYHGNLAASAAAVLARGRPAVAWNVRHSLYALDDEKRLTRWIIRAGRILSSRTDATVYNSSVSREQHEAFGFCAERGRVIPNGFDLDQLRPDRSVAGRVRGEFGIPETAMVVGHVARFHPMKDHASFLRAAVKVADAFPDAHFLVVGRGVDLETSVLSGIVPERLIDRFVFPGERADVTDLMRGMDVLCTSSAWGEAFPNVLGEAMACGVPCVATDVGDSREIVGDTGWVVSPAEQQALAAAIEQALSMSEDERQALGRGARQRVEAGFSLGAVFAQYVKLYGDMDNNVIGGRMRERGSR